MSQAFHAVRWTTLAAFSVVLPVSGAGASTLEEAADFYLNFAAGSAEIRAQLGEKEKKISVEDLHHGAVMTFGRAMNNLDDVLTLADIEDRARRNALKYESFSTNDPDRYDLNRDGVVTETEINVFFAREAWKGAFSEYQDGEPFQDVKTRFDQRLETLVGRFRDRAEIPDSGDILVENTAEFTERGLDALNYRGPEQMPYMSIFDLDQNQIVSFEEFVEPIKLAAARADADGNGLIDDKEFAAIEKRSEEIKIRLREVDGKYGFSPSDTK